MKLPKTGKNEYSNFTYYELKDILPAINKLCDKHGVCWIFSIESIKEKERARLVVVDTDEDKSASFVLPTAEVEIGVKKDGSGGAQPIQNLGGKSSYLKRYLLVTAFGIAETDMVDRVNREFTDEIEEKDLEKMKKAKTVKELALVAKELQGKYKKSLLVPEYQKLKVILEQDEDTQN